MTEHEKDIEFLLKRAMQAGRCDFEDTRDTGLSSNSIVGIAYGIIKLQDQKLPSDPTDLRACENMFNKLPEHRKTENVLKAMASARNYRVIRGY